MTFIVTSIALSLAPLGIKLLELPAQSPIGSPSTLVGSSRSYELKRNLDKTTEAELICHPPLGGTRTTFSRLRLCRTTDKPPRCVELWRGQLWTVPCRLSRPVSTIWGTSPVKNTVSRLPRPGSAPQRRAHLLEKANQNADTKH